MPNSTVQGKLKMRAYDARSSAKPAWLLTPPFVAIVFLWITRTNDVTTIGALYSFSLLLVPWTSFLLWRQDGRGGLPVFAMLGFTYWWWFVPSLFWLDRTLWVGRRAFNTASVDEAVLLALVGVISLGLGMKVRIQPPSALRELDLDDRSASWFYVRLILLIGTLGALLPESRDILGANGRQIMDILISTVPVVALLLLLRRFLTNPNSRFDRGLLCAYFPLRILAGLSSGWVGSVVSLAVVCGVMYILVRRKIPWLVVAVSIAAVLFLEVGKKDFRERYWYQGTTDGIVEKAAFWMNASASKWYNAVASDESNSSGSLTAESLARSSLLPQVAHVLDLTPSQIPFQEGRTYSYMAFALVPRFLWPDKPSVNDANRYYQIAFGLSTAKNVNKVNIGAGCLAESYINFGWFGAIFIMFGIGTILGFYERSFLSRDSNTLFLAIGIALLPGVLGIESQMSAYLGGVIQTVLLTILIFLPVLRRRSARTVNFRPHNPGMLPSVAGTRVGPAH